MISPGQLMVQPQQTNMLPESSVKLEQNVNQQIIVLEDPHVPQTAKDWISSLLEGEYNSIISKSP